MSWTRKVAWALAYVAWLIWAFAYTVLWIWLAGFLETHKHGTSSRIANAGVIWLVAFGLLSVIGIIFTMISNAEDRLY